jgi:hypothetical protein
MSINHNLAILVCKHIGSKHKRFEPSSPIYGCVRQDDLMGRKLAVMLQAEECSSVVNGR